MINRLTVSIRVVLFFSMMAFGLYFMETGFADLYFELFRKMDHLSTSAIRYNKAVEVYQRKRIGSSAARLFAYFCIMRDYFVFMCLWSITRQLIMIFVHGSIGIDQFSIDFLTRNFVLEAMQYFLIIFAFHCVNLKWIMQLVSRNFGEYYRFLCSYKIYKFLEEETYRNSIITNSIYKDHVRKVTYLGTNGSHKSFLYDLFVEGKLNLSSLMTTYAFYFFVAVYQILAVTNRTPSTIEIANGVEIDLVQVTCLACYLFYANFSWIVKSQLSWIFSPVYNILLSDNGLLGRLLSLVMSSEEPEGTQAGVNEAGNADTGDDKLAKKESPSKGNAKVVEKNKVAQQSAGKKKSGKNKSKGKKRK